MTNMPKTKKELSGAELFMHCLKYDQKAIIEFCEREIAEYQKLIDLLNNKTVYGNNDK